MGTKRTKAEVVAMFNKIIDDKKAMCECIRKGGDIREVANERGMQLYNPISGKCE